jgi:N-methylhydantoinase B
MTLHIDDNLEQRADGIVSWRRCGTVTRIAAEPLRDARVSESEPEDSGPSVRTERRHLTDRPVILRQSFCPQGLTLVRAEIVRADEPPFRARSLAVPS